MFNPCIAGIRHEDAKRVEDRQLAVLILFDPRFQAHDQAPAAPSGVFSRISWRSS